MRKLIDLLFGCPHRKTTFPITPRGRRTYLVCLHCGREFDYDWEEMRIVMESGA